MAVEVRSTDRFDRWLDQLKDERARAKVLFAIRKMSLGLMGDVKPVGEGVSECRIHAGPGYRLYFVQRGATLVVLLCGGDKSSQSLDIALARRLAKESKADDQDRNSRL